MYVDVKYNHVLSYRVRKRFERAEKEYIASKISLHESQERKEQLTEHLYTVIQQNEMR